MTPRLRMIAVGKSFGATKALRNVSFEVAPGEVHALVGENGAGKSTLMKILSGASEPDAGSIDLDGKPFTPENPHHARRCGIAMIYQELNLAPHLSVEENILLGEEPRRFGWLDRRKRRELARSALAELHHDTIPLDAPVHTLTIAEQQVVEIARALVREPRVLVMDEPTSSLTQVDTENLFAVIGRLRARGVSVVYISHFLEECQRVCDRFTVLRDGETAGAGDMKTAKLTHIIRLMVGREMKDIYPHVPHEIGTPVLELRGVAVRAVFGLDELAAGEILCLGSARVSRAVVGAPPTTPAGALAAEPASGRPAGRRTERPRRARSPSESLRTGLGLLSENRKEEGLMLGRSLADNLTLTKLKPFSRFGFISSRGQQQAARDWMQRLDVRARSPGQHAAELSGGNQQKVALGRLLHHDARILLLDEPTRGIDVGSKAQIYRLIGELAAQGKAVLFISSYLPELLGVCDTIAVMCRGVLSDAKPAGEWTEHSIISAAIGQSEEKFSNHG
ncbi:MAG: sugar ABC transporter ATP-binding protein [Verrucomicrobia bacterium]|nr:sugar ABC transporter ATP-binding protein [Verrucomicrobiota bacterium]